MSILSLSSIQEPRNSHASVGEFRKGKWSIMKLLKGVFLTISLISHGILSNAQSIPDPGVSVVQFANSQNNTIATCTYERLVLTGWSGVSQTQGHLDCYFFGEEDGIVYSVNAYNLPKCPGNVQMMDKSKLSHTAAKIKRRVASGLGTPSALTDMNTADVYNKVLVIESGSPGTAVPLGCGVAKEIKLI